MRKGDSWMKCEFKKLLAVVVGFGILSAPVRAADADAAAEAKVAAAAEKAVESDATTQPEEDPKDIQNKLLGLTTLENAFFKALRTQTLLRRFIIQENGKLEKTEDEAEKEEIRKQIAAARTRLQTIAIAMDVVFGIGRRREYEYNRVTSTIYLKVGTVEQAFARGVQTRNLLQKYVQDQTALKDAETDEAKLKEIDARILAGTKRWQTVSASLQLIFGVVPQRNYQYNPKNSVLYLKVSDNEVEKLKEQAAALQAEKDKAAGGAAEGDGN